MKYKEFVKWCNDRASDGCWGMSTAIFCIEVVKEIDKEPFWKREKKWRKIYENTIVYEIINPINKKIQELKEKWEEKWKYQRDLPKEEKRTY